MARLTRSAVEKSDLGIRTPTPVWVDGEFETKVFHLLCEGERKVESYILVPWKLDGVSGCRNSMWYSRLGSL